jgi:hypothetical protein
MDWLVVAAFIGTLAIAAAALTHSLLRAEKQ